MRINFKALLLSALVVPGLGQIYKGEKIKGAAIICFVNIFLLGALFMVLQGAGQLIAINAVGSTDPASILATLKAKSPAARWLLAAFFGIWIFGAVDAAKK
jgi:TM2 domain-containing membrane protein YozV